MSDACIVNELVLQHQFALAKHSSLSSFWWKFVLTFHPTLSFLFFWHFQFAAL